MASPYVFQSVGTHAMECGAIDFKQFHHDPSLAHMILVRTQAAVQQ
ncbi:hypothetical protein BofuT4_uP002930.1 [Botrytis cinerea T4]|uniref:Uncharacterized protein n=1 Tax=Botryotinia fuckeliana (strain T4) TaxID=999810 RepID=G2Y394_BOTF4|nr:hypothetical protein BofuT4_uP002930.1 [Botrytis cinerea T4]